MQQPAYQHPSLRLPAYQHPLRLPAYQHQLRLPAYQHPSLRLGLKMQRFLNCHIQPLRYVINPQIVLLRIGSCFVCVVLT